MHHDHALFNLVEAKEALEQLIAEMQSDPEYDYGNYLVDMTHIYWHLNAAWNGRDFDLLTTELTDAMAESFRQFPTDLEL